MDFDPSSGRDDDPSGPALPAQPCWETALLRFLGSAGPGQTLALWWMDAGGSSGQENANLYMRGVKEGYDGEVLDGEHLLEILDVFGEDGLRSYILGHVEGVVDALEDAEEPD